MALPEMQHAADSKHCRRCGAAYVYDAVYLGHLGHYHCPNCGAHAARARRSRPRDVELRRHARRARSRSHARRRRGASTLPLPGLYNVYNALGAAALGTRARRAARRRRRRPGGGRARVRPRRDDRASAAATLSILLVKNPAGANEVLRTLALEPGEHDLLGVLNDRIADGRDVSWVWDADFELLAPARAARHVRAARAPRSWPCG